MKEYKIKGTQKENKIYHIIRKRTRFSHGLMLYKNQVFITEHRWDICLKIKKVKEIGNEGKIEGKEGDRGRQPAWVYHFVRAWFRWNEKEKRIGYQVGWYTKPRRSCSSDDRSCKPAGSVASVKYYANATAVFLVNFRCRNGSSMVAFDHQSSASATVCWV